ncbi:MAG: hypothetical protein SO100_05970 [Dysosmobacter sp.]|nr:hypothetical protein [Dysosmobacter sp.]
MQSKTSFFNRTLFRKNLSRYWPLWGFASFVGFLAPAAALVRMAQSGSMSVEPLVVREGYYYLLGNAVPIASLVYAILCAMAVWSYLYNPRSVGMMHSLPIRREGLFLANLLSGLAMMAIPYLVAGGLGTLLFACCGGFDAWGTLVTILAVIGQSVTFFGLATFCAFLTGNIFALPVLYFLFHFLPPLGDWLCNLFARGFLFGFTADYSGTVDFLCPMVYLTQRLYVNSEYETVRDSALEYQNRLTSVTLENAWLIAAYAAAGLVFLALAYLLYRRRESERAGDVVAVRVFRPVFRFGVAALSALLGGRLLYALLWESFQAGDTFTPVPMAICLMVAGLIGYYAASMLLAKSLRVFRGSAVGALCLVAACAAFCAGMRFDLFGIERRVPAQSEIAQLEIYLASNTYYLTPEDQPELLSGAQDLQRTLIAQKDLIRSNYETYRHGSTSSDPDAYTNIRYIYTLKNGATVERFYTVSFARSDLSVPGSYANAMDAYVNSPALRQARLRWGDPEFHVESGSFDSQSTGDYFNLGTQECETLLSAIARDAENGNWGRYDWFEDDGTAYAMDLSFDFYRDLTDEHGTHYQSYDSIYITVRPEMTETKQALLDLNLATEQDFVTWQELNGITTEA